MDYLELTSTPVAEECAQVGKDDYYERVKKECKAFIGQLRRQFGEEPFGCRLYIKANPHDFGTYHEVAIKFNENDETACEYAFNMENNLPEYWDDQAKVELGLASQLY